jgi:hypothetical protein
MVGSFASHWLQQQTRRLLKTETEKPLKEYGRDDPWIFLYIFFLGDTVILDPHCRVWDGDDPAAGGGQVELTIRAGSGQGLFRLLQVIACEQKQVCTRPL